MADFTAQERLQPSLLDRLIDDEPGQQQESRERRVLSVSQLRKGVLRDLAWLLNTGHLSDVDELDRYPLVAGSVLNYGMPDLSGCTASSIDIAQIERMVKKAIVDFEPRIMPNSIRVRAVISPDEMNRNALAFEINGELWAQPMPERLFLRTQIDLESGSVSVAERTGR